jgi:hypothetical protein
VTRCSAGWLVDLVYAVCVQRWLFFVCGGGWFFSDIVHVLIRIPLVESTCWGLLYFEFRVVREMDVDKKEVKLLQKM